MKLPFRLRFTPQMAVRIIADALMVNAALLTAMALRLLLMLGATDRPLSVHNAFQIYLSGYLGTFWWLTLISLVIFYVSGFYTRGRIYRGRYKILVIAQAVSLSYLIFGFSLLFLWPAFFSCFISSSRRVFSAATGRGWSSPLWQSSW
jgi:hypothetical protein